MLTPSPHAEATAVVGMAHAPRRSKQYRRARLAEMLPS
jgi:hypothetical protein